MEEVYNKLINDFSNLDKIEQQKAIDEQLKDMLATYTDILKKLGGNEATYINKYMKLDDPEPNFNELVYAYLISIDDITGKLLLHLMGEEE